MTKKFGLRTEILITLSLLLGAALLFGGLIMLRFTEARLLEERISQLETHTQLLSRILLNEEANPTAIRTTKLRPFLLQNLHCLNGRIYDQDLQLLDSWPNAADAKATAFSLAHLSRVKLTGETQRLLEFPTLLNIFAASRPQVQFLVPLKQGQRFVGLLDLSYSLADIRLKLLQSQGLILVYIVLYGIVLIGAGYFLLQRNVIRPARNLLKATDDVGRGNLETRLPVEGPLEIADLSRAYNRMVEALQLSRGETQAQITRLEQTNQELKQTRDVLIRSEKMASIGQLAAGLAHELGNPLAALIGYLELLKSQIEKGENRDIIERSLAEAGRIDFLVRELLDFSRPEQELRNDEADLVAELNSAVQLLHNQGVLTDLTILSQLPQRLPGVRINRNRLQQVFVNLLLNAAQACSSPGTLTLTAGAELDQTWIAIADDGCGIEEAALLKIFDPFYTTKAPGIGTGLGLAICQRIVEEAQGRIEVNSIPGRGSCFRLDFPRM